MLVKYGRYLSDNVVLNDSPSIYRKQVCAVVCLRNDGSVRGVRGLAALPEATLGALVTWSGHLDGASRWVTGRAVVRDEGQKSGSGSSSPHIPAAGFFFFARGLRS